MDLETASDAHLAGRIANGEAEAVRPMIDRYSRPLTALLQRALGSHADVDDAFQETWIRVVRSAHRYDPTYRFSQWLFGIAWNVMRDHWARQVRTEDVDLAAMPAETQSAEERAVAADQARRLRALVGKLPERLSEAIFLRYFEELSEKEVASRLGVPVGTVKSRVHNGLRQLAATMKGS